MAIFEDVPSVVLAYHGEGQDAKPYQEREATAAIRKSQKS